MNELIMKLRELTFVIGKSDVLIVVGVPRSCKLEGREPVLDDPLHVRQVLTWLKDGLQVAGGPHVHDEETAVRFYKADHGICQTLKTFFLNQFSHFTSTELSYFIRSQHFFIIFKPSILSLPLKQGSCL